MFTKLCALLCLVAVAQAQKAEQRSGEAEDSARLLFSNYTSGKSNDLCAIGCDKNTLTKINLVCAISAQQRQNFKILVPNSLILWCCRAKK